MAKYLIESSPTPQAYAAMIKNPQDRAETIRPLMEKMGGKKVDTLKTPARAGWFCFYGKIAGYRSNKTIKNSACPSSAMDRASASGAESPSSSLGWGTKEAWFFHQTSFSLP